MAGSAGRVTPVAAARPARRVLASRVLEPGLRALLVLILLVTGTAKLLDMGGFAAIVATYRAVPDALVVPGAWLVALGEVALAAWIASGVRLPLAALGSAAMHALYMVWAALALARGIPIGNCGCFGVFWARPLTFTTLLEDTALVAGSLLLARVAGRSR